MHAVDNKFGIGVLYEEKDLKGLTYAVCTACMSIWSEFLSWANAHRGWMADAPAIADNIVVLSCQVTDLAVLNDLQHLEVLMKMYPGKKFFVGGCLARRFDIPLPEDVHRLDNLKSDHTMIEDRNLVFYSKPFWVLNFDENESKPLADGHLFRNMYPLRIGTGCKKKCTYCTIRETRGKPTVLAAKDSLDEFRQFNDILLIADSPNSAQIRDWCAVAFSESKQISIRNIEPSVARSCALILLQMAQNRLLKYFHCPIQSNVKSTLQDMGRSYEDVTTALTLIEELRHFGVICATNIIIDYKDFLDPGMDMLYKIFDYVSWNPYWDGKWDRELAEKRFKKYLG